MSTVRTTGAGFLKSVNRMNVMLTRCKAGMVLVTNRSFLCNAGRDTLLGKLAQRWGAGSDVWVDSRALSDRSASLPGVPGRTTSFYLPISAPVPMTSREPEATGRSARVVPGAWPGAVTSRSDREGSPRGSMRPSGHAGYHTFTDNDVVASLRRSPQPYGSVAVSGRQTLVNMSKPPLGERSSNADVGAWGNSRFDEQFPTLDGSGPSQQPQVKGRWRAGSGACRL